MSDPIDRNISDNEPEDDPRDLGCEDAFEVALSHRERIDSGPAARIGFRPSWAANSGFDRRYAAIIGSADNSCIKSSSRG